MHIKYIQEKGIEDANLIIRAVEDIQHRPRDNGKIFFKVIFGEVLEYSSGN